MAMLGSCKDPPSLTAAPYSAPPHPRQPHHASVKRRHKTKSAHGESNNGRQRPTPHPPQANSVLPPPARTMLALKGVKKPSVPMAKEMTGGSGSSSVNRLARCSTVPSPAEGGKQLFGQSNEVKYQPCLRLARCSTVLTPRGPGGRAAGQAAPVEQPEMRCKVTRSYARQGWTGAQAGQQHTYRPLGAPPQA